jgi:protocatechuate 3,4-dioxygenase beta subunit
MPDLPPQFRRRDLLKVAAVSGAVATTIPVVSQAAKKASKPKKTTTKSAAATKTVASCTLSPESTEGPYYVEGPLVRKDITEGRGGVPLDLRIAVVDSRTCLPIADAAVDIWHCDAGGVYSGAGANATSASGTESDRFLRGVQLTDASGIATFASIYPGWYPGRAVHIHVKVRVGGKEAKTYDGGHTAHTGQLFFDEALSDRVFVRKPYNTASGSRRRQSDDGIFRQSGSAKAVASSAPKNSADLSKGITSTITLSVDPTATPSGGGGPGGPPPGGDLGGLLPGT